MSFIITETGKFEKTLAERKKEMDSNERNEGLAKDLECFFEAMCRGDDLTERCEELGCRFVELFDKIYKHTDDESIELYVSEMQSLYGEALELENDGDKLNDRELSLFFFSAEYDPEELIMDKNESEMYERFCDGFKENDNVSQNFRSIGLLGK